MTTTRYIENCLIPVLIAVVLMLTAPSILAQEKAPERGFRPGGSFALSDIETISTTSGNMIVKLPLASLPPGRGGLSASLNLIYNSKLYDSFPSSAYINHSYYDVTNLKKSQAAGWRYGYQYELYGEGRYGGVDEMGEINPCSYTTYIAKLALLTPDGGKHELRLTGHTDGDGFHDVWQDGRAACWGGTGVTNTLVYYTTDGTFLRLEVQHDSDSNLLNNPWTLYLPDGGRVTGGNAPQRIYDRNNNYIEIVNDILPNGHAATHLNDQVGRSIMIEYESATNQDTVHVTGYNGAALTTTVSWANVQVQKAYSRGVGTPFNLPATWRSVSQITLPSQAGSLTYLFTYNANGGNPTVGWGELNSITLPSGAKSSYTYDLDSQNNTYVETVLHNRPTQKQLVYRPEYDGNVSNAACTSGCITETWTYGMTFADIETAVSSTITGPDGGVSTEYFNRNEDGTLNQAGLVYKSVAPDGAVSERFWQPNIPYTSSIYVFNETHYPKYEFTSIPNASGTLTQTAIKEYNYDKNGNVTRVAAYDWVPYANVPRNGQVRPYAPPSGVLPKTISVNTYFNPTPDASNSTTYDSDAFQVAGSPRLHRLLESSEVRDGSNTTFSRTEVLYDNTSATTVVTYPIGNPTQQKRWDSTKGTLPIGSGNIVTTSTQYDAYGNPILTTDPRGYQTQLTYDPINGYSGLYPTKSKVAYGTGVQRYTSAVYDYYTGVVKQSKDEDNVVTTTTSYDDLGRPTLVENADGKSEETRTVTNYSDTYRRLIVRSDLNDVGDGKLVSIRHYDQLGRIRLARQLEDAATESETDETKGIKAESRYLTSGSYAYHLTSNPHRTTTDSTMGWTRSKTDVGGRVVEMQTFGGGGLPAPWGTNTTSTGTVTTAYDAQFTTVTDQAGKVRRSMTNGLGQLARVDEPTTSGLGPTSSPNQPTSYTYDALSNLLKVEQGTQYRYFMYDSLSRLRRAKNPEQDYHSTLNLSDPLTGNSQWSIGYQYDDNGNLTQKTDARGTVSSFVYDALNRNTSVDYSDTTPDVFRQYDQATSNGKGRLNQTWQSGTITSATYIDSYDALGRPLVQRQKFETGGVWSSSYQVSRSYNRAGGVITQTYPSVRTVNYNYDAAGRLGDKDASDLAFKGNLGDGTLRTYAQGILYSPMGGMTKEQFGTDTPTPIYNKSFYNNRGQLSEIRVSTSYTGPTDTDWNRGAILNQYSAQCSGPSCNGTDNNGNVKRQEVWLPHNDQITTNTNWYQLYDYDELNRLQRVKEYNSANSQLWQQEYQYDSWGNRTLHQTNTWGTGINKKDFAVNPANNRLGVPGGQSGTMAYDNAGNLITDSYSGAGSREYDAENRMTKAWGWNNQWQEYSYNADGQRVRRKVNGAETWQVYGMDGELLAEYAANAAPTSPQKEYGYRNGQLLITASTTQGCGVGYSGSKNWTATNASLGHATGQQEGSNWAVYVGSHSPNAMVYGPYDTTFGQGHHTAQFWLMVDNNSGTDVVATVDVVTNYGGSTLAQRQIRRNEFVGANQWQVFTLEFDNPCFGLVESRVWWSGTVNMKFSQVTITATNTAAVDIEWLVADQLGTPRMVINKAGSLVSVKRHDYLPFGEELFAGTGGRTTAQGYSQIDNVRQKFTLKERDNETNLDYFLARYYSSTQGRFTSADEPFADQDEDDPQSWNLYQYAGNNPLLFTDPTGMWKWVDPDNNGNRFLQWEEGDDWKSLATFLNNNSDDTYRASDLEKAFGGGGLGAETIVDVTGAIPKFTNTRGLENSSWDLVPFGGGARVASKAGIFGRIARAFGFGGVRSAAKITASTSVPVLVKQGVIGVSKGNLKHIGKHLDSFRRLDPSMTVDKLVELGHQIAGRAENLIGSPGGRKVFEEVVNVGGKEVKVRAVLNPAGGLRSVHIRQ